jgi:hypothetical protein
MDFKIDKDVADKIFQYLTKGVEVVSEQSIELINQIIKYEIFKNTVMFILFSASLVLCIFALKTSINTTTEYYSEEREVKIIASSISVFIFSAVWLIHLDKLFKVIFAPNLVVIEYIKGML